MSKHPMEISELKAGRALKQLRRMSLVILLMAALGSLGFVIRAGRNNHSVLLRLLFIFWVLSPFVGLMMTNYISKSSAVPVRRMIYILIILICACSILCYSGLIGPKGMKPAFIFLVVPLISWILISVVVPISASISRKSKEKKNRI